MPIDDQLIPFYFKTAPGMDNHTDELDLNGLRVRLAQNCRFEAEPGAVSKRPPMAYYNAAEMGSSGPLLGTYRFYSASGAKQICVRDSGVYVGDDATGTMTQIRTLTTTTLKMSFVTYNKLMIAGNGTDNLFVYDGSSDNVTWELGACKAVIGSSTGITRTAISYAVEITTPTGSYVCGAISNEIASVTDQSINLSYIPLGPLGTTERKIYRKSSETSGYRLIDTINNNTTTTYTDTTADASAGTQMPTVNDDMPRGNILLVHKERLFVSGDPSNENTIYYSNPFLPHLIQQTTNLDLMEIAKDDGDKITGVKNWQGTLIVIKQNNLRKIGVASALSNADPTSWYVEDPVAQIGSPAPWSIVETPFGVVFLGWDDWFVYNGGVPQAIIRQFDCGDILPSLYNSVVSYFNDGILYAAYADKESTPQHANRIMCYDYLLDKLSIDTIEASCFASASGVDETSELYIGSADGGWLYKAEEGDNWHRLSGKSQIQKGTSYSTFIGGTESSPTIEIGSSVAASAIPENLCIFWIDETTTPGTGWTELTAPDGRFFYISTSSVGTTGGTSSHSHTVSGTADMSTVRYGECGDSGVTSTNNQHTHTISITSGSATDAFPKNVKLRIFYKNALTTEYLFPTGAIIMWDQNDEPDGWLARVDFDTCYLMCGTTGVGEPDKDPSHTHTASGSTSSDGTAGDADIGTSAGGVHPAAPHNHPVTVSVWSASTSSWDLNAITFRLIQKVGEESTWDGSDKYAYCLYHSDAAIGGGWTDVTSSFTGLYIKANSSPLTQVTASASHTHGVTVTVEENTGYGGEGGYHNSSLMNHTHTSTGTVSTETLPNPLYYSFKLVKKILGKMSAYNDAILTSYQNGMYESVGIQINSESMGKLYMNVSKGTADTISVFFRTGATKASVEDATSATFDAGTDTFTSAGHGLSDGDRVAISAATMPTGIVNTKMYYVVASTPTTFQISETLGGSAVDGSTTGTTVVFKKWSSELSSSGLDMTATANVWIQYMIVFKAADSTADLPKLYTADGYTLKFSYRRSGTIAETSVEFIYDTGNLNFDEPMLDKIYKKIISEHAGEQGSLTIQWTTENATNSFTFDLASYPKRWQSFFHSTAMGSTLAIRFYKNDLYTVTLKEFKGLLTPQPMLI